MNAPNATVLAAVMTNRPSPPAVQAGVCGSRACGWRGMGARVQRAVGLAASAREAGMPRPLCLRSADALRGRRVELERSPRSVGQARKEDLLSQGPAPCRIAAHAPESAVTREYVDPLSIPPCWGGVKSLRRRELSWYRLPRPGVGTASAEIGTNNNSKARRDQQWTKAHAGISGRDSGGQKAQSTGTGAGRPAPKDALILVVDDSRTIVVALQRALESHGYLSMPAFDGVQAVEIAKRRLPDLILMDIVMPRMNGFEAARACCRPADAARPGDHGERDGKSLRPGLGREARGQSVPGQTYCARAATCQGRCRIGAEPTPAGHGQRRGAGRARRANALGATFAPMPCRSPRQADAVRRGSAMRPSGSRGATSDAYYS